MWVDEAHPAPLDSEQAAPVMRAVASFHRNDLGVELLNQCRQFLPSDTLGDYLAVAVHTMDVK
jgi:hypothetical protein